MTALLQYKELGTDGASGYSGGSQAVDVVLQARLFSFRANPKDRPANFDANVIVGHQWVTWHPDLDGQDIDLPSGADLKYSGNEIGIGLSANFLFRFAIEYLVFKDAQDIDPSTVPVCHGTCPGPSGAVVHGEDHAVMLEIGMILGDDGRGFSGY